MKDINSLKVIQCKYRDTSWAACLAGGKEHFTADVEEFSQRREVDLYNLCGVYGTAGVPYEVHDIDYENYPEYEPFEAITREFSDAVCSGVQEDKAVLIAGGYCNYAPAIAGGLQRAVGEDKKIGVVWIDAHSDNQRLEDYNEPVRLVAVPVSVMTGQTLPGYRSGICGLNRPLDGHNILISDARDTLEDEEANMRSASITRLRSSDFDDPAIWKSSVEALADRIDTIYLAVDADILDSHFIPAYEYEIPGGHHIDTVMNNIAAVMATGKVNVFSVGCVDFDHYERGGEYTYLSGMKLIASGLQSWKTKAF